MTIDEVREFLKTNKDDEKVKVVIAEYATAPTLTVELVTPWLETPEGQKLIQPYGDRRANEAVKTHDEKMAPKIKADVNKLVAAELLKMSPKEESPGEKRLREVEIKLEESENARQDEILKSRLSAEALKLKVDAHAYLLDDFKPSSFEDGVVKLQKIKKHEDELVTAAINEFMVKNSVRPGSGSTGGKKGPMTAKEYAALPFAERIKLQESGEAAKIVS